MQPLDACGIILAGGQSRRMGSNKALLPFHGQPLIGRVAARLRPWFRQMVIVTHTPEAFRFLDLPVVSDPAPGLGPLGGLQAGLAFSQSTVAFVAACDMPFISVDLAAEMVRRAVNGAHDAVVPTHRGVPEPLHAVYARSCLPAIAELLAAGDRKVQHLLGRVRTLEVPEQEVRRFGDPDRLFFNCNTPADLDAALAWEE